MWKNAGGRISWWIAPGGSIPPVPRFMASCAPSRDCRAGSSDRAASPGSRGSMREIVLDTETTGLDPTRGDRLVEIGCVELYNHIRTGQTYHLYINPERAMPEEAFQVHGLSAEFLADKPVFADIVDAFLD